MKIAEISAKSEAQREYLEAQAKLTEKNQDGEVIRPCVVVDLKEPSNGIRSTVYFGNPYEENPVLIALPSRISSADAKEILATVVPIPEFCKMLEHLASARDGRQISIIEGETSIGKTLAANVFTRLLYGRKVVPLDFYCVGQTDVSELMGKWVPDVESQFAPENLPADVRAGAVGDEALALVREFAHALSQSNQKQWKFQLGAIPKAFSGEVDIHGQFILPADGGTGCTLLVQEIGLAKPVVVDAFLKARGERGRLAATIQIWEDGGRIIDVGDEAFVVMTTNPPESYIDRNELDAALVRASSFLRLGHLSSTSLKMIAKAVFAGGLGATSRVKPTPWATDLSGAKELNVEIASLLALFHEKAFEALKGGEIGRVQRIVPTTDDFDRVYARVVRQQVLTTGPTGILEVAIVPTLERAIAREYLGRLSDPKKIESLQKTLNSLLREEVGRVDFRGAQNTREEVLNTLANEHLVTLRKSRPALDPILEAKILTLQTRVRDRWTRLAEGGHLSPLH